LTSVGNMITARVGHIASVLTNEKVLATGGFGSNGALMSAELYDPLTGFWKSTRNMITARQAHTKSVLTNGKVLVAADEIVIIIF